MVNDWCPKTYSRLYKIFIPPTALFILLFSGLFDLIYEKPNAQAQVQVIPEEPTFDEVALKLAGAFCDVNAAESAVLHLKGVIMVDIETRKGYLIVGYDPDKVSPEQMVEAVGKKRGKNGACTATVVGVGRP